MVGVNLSGSRLKGANLRSVNLMEAQNLTQGQIDLAFGDAGTKLPANLNLVVPDHWDSTTVKRGEPDPRYLKWRETSLVFDPEDQDDTCPERRSG